MSWFIIQRRYLTQGERALAQEIFAHHLQLDDIQIIAHRLILKGYALSPNGHIYFHPQDYCADFSQQEMMYQAWLIHELVHVWQLQQGIAVVRKALLDRRYRYLLEQGKHFLEYGVEQQAQMVQDYFIRKKLGQKCDDLAQCIPFISS